MILPRSQDSLQRRVLELIETCTQTRMDRASIYNRREAYYLHGTCGSSAVKYNRIMCHLDLVSSFVYSPDHAFYHISAEQSNDDHVIKQAIALQDSFNDDFQDSGTSDRFGEAVPWSLVYDTMIFKQGWNNLRRALTAELIAPYDFGVYDERIPDLDSQQAFCHTYYLDYYESIWRIARAGQAKEINKIEVSNKPAFEMPSMLSRMIISQTGGLNIQGNVLGQINPSYTPAATYQSDSRVPLIEWNELWVWDDEAGDYRFFQVCRPDILISDSKDTVEALRAVPGRFESRMPEGGDEDFYRTKTNYFLPHDHPFTAITPYGKYNYFWGIAHIDSLTVLQDWMSKRLDQIDDILEKQADPPKVGSGFTGLSDESMEAFGGAGTYLFDQMPSAQVKELAPQMPPNLFADFQQINGLFLEASGLTEVLQGKGEEGVRSRQHAQELRKTGGGRIRKTAQRIEVPLTRIGDIGLKLKQKNDDEPLHPEPDEKDKVEKFYPCQIASQVKIRVDGHSHSPLFGDEAREIAILLKKSQAIENEMFVRMLNPPSKENIIHSLRRQEKAKQQMLKQHPELLQSMMKGGGHSHKK